MKTLVASLTLASALVACGSKSTIDRPGPHAHIQYATRSEAIKKAHQLYRLPKKAGMNFKNGPCISNGKDIPGWVFDIAHNPRQPVDDIPKNQCSAFANGQVAYFVELDLKGRLIRTGP